MTSAPVFAIVPVSVIGRSPTNPRKTFPADYISELASSIGLKGIISPLLVRSTDDLPAPVGHQYELIAGECRLRAALEAGLVEVPVLIRDDLSGNDILELQLIENLQRRELDVLEESESYAALLALEDGGVKRHTAESLAAAIGKSHHYVLERLKLLVLPESAREAMRSGELIFSVARLVASIPSASLREKALEEVLHPTYEEGPLSKRQAAAWIRDHYMTEIKKVPYDKEDAELVPVEHDAMGQRVRGGACSDCPWLSKNLRSEDPEHPGAGNPHLCMNPGCHSAKLDASWDSHRMEALKAGKRVLSDEESEKEVSSYDSGLSWDSKYVELKSTVPHAELAESGEKPPTWKKLLSQVSVKPEIVVLRDRNHRPLECVLKREAVAAIKLEAEKGGTPSPLRTRGSGSDEEKAVKAEQRASANRERIVAKDALHRCMTALVELFASEKAPDDSTLWPRMLDLLIAHRETSLLNESLGLDVLDDEGLRTKLVDSYPVGGARSALAPYVLLLLGLDGAHWDFARGVFGEEAKDFFKQWDIDAEANLAAAAAAHPAPEPEKAEKASKKRKPRKESISAGEELEPSEEPIDLDPSDEDDLSDDEDAA